MSNDFICEKIGSAIYQSSSIIVQDLECSLCCNFCFFDSMILCFDCVSVCIFFVHVESYNPLGSDVFSLLQPLFVLCGLPTPLRPTVKGSDKEPASVTLCHSATALTPYWESTCLPA